MHTAANEKVLIIILLFTFLKYFESIKFYKDIIVTYFVL